MIMKYGQTSRDQEIAASEHAERHALPTLPPDSVLKSYDFHRLVALIENAGRTSALVGDTKRPMDEPIRFRATRSLSFGPGDISQVAWDADRKAHEIRVNFFGLYGPSSPLPAHFTERIIEDDRSPSPMEDLFDLFNHRLISLLHLIWRKHQYHLRFEAGGNDAISGRFLALCGFPIEKRDDIGGISRSMIISQIGLLAMQARSAQAAATALAALLKVPCRIKEFMHRRLWLDEDSLLGLGKRNAMLGEDTVLGSEIDDVQGQFRLCIGRAPYRQLAPLMPGGRHHRLLSDLLAIINRSPLEWDLEFSLTPGTIPAARLGTSRLGWSSWLSAASPSSLDSVVRMTPESGQLREAPPA